MKRLKEQVSSVFEHVTAWRHTLAARGVFSEQRNSVRAESMFLARALQRIDIDRAADKVSPGMVPRAGLSLSHWWC